MEKISVSIFLSLNRFFKVILCLFFILLFFNIITGYFKFILGHPYVYGTVPLFDFDSENNIPTYFSSFILLFSAILLKIIALFEKKNRNPFSCYWSFLSVVFLFLSIDEASSIHELFILPLREEFNLSGIFYYSWIILGIIFVLILLIFYYRFLFDLPKETRNNFIVAGAVYLMGAIVFEMIGGYYIDLNPGKELVYSVITSFEESLEMIGIIIFINSLLRYIEKKIYEINFSFKY
ncbi:hypothetical protein [uncultured Ilyobacter sp.]|uniref:hypothetical protein n=1 Tax=uncultured Ilyobacter sp. TaxID=544433 RepID=UPI0029C9A474|nr:hypothetical protein [uncultured Ilyobacter sp.]